MKYLLLYLFLMATVVMLIGQSASQTYFTISAPEGWNIVGVGCGGITASDFITPSRGIIALNHLHQNFDMLPPYTSPETYLESYMPQDFSQGNDQVTNMKILGYEDDQDLANAYTSFAGPLTSAKSMRCSFEVNGVPAVGSFLVATKELYGYGSTVDLLLGIFAPADQFDENAPMLLDTFNSIRLIREYFCLCFSCKGQCDYQCTNGCCDHLCDENDRCT